MKFIDNQHIRLLAKTMDVYSLRQKMTAANIANMDTPGFKRVSVSFEEELQKIDEGALRREPDNLNPKIIQTDDKPVLENELLEMADTQMRVQLVSRALRHNFEQIRSGITGRSG